MKLKPEFEKRDRKWNNIHGQQTIFFFVCVFVIFFIQVTIEILRKSRIESHITSILSTETMKIRI